MITILSFLSDIPGQVGESVRGTIALFISCAIAGLGFAVVCVFVLRWSDARRAQATADRLTPMRHVSPAPSRPFDDSKPPTEPLPVIPPTAAETAVTEGPIEWRKTPVRKSV